jgi:hypothetical protein
MRWHRILDELYQDDLVVLSNPRGSKWYHVKHSPEGQKLPDEMGQDVADEPPQETRPEDAAQDGDAT